LQDFSQALPDSYTAVMQTGQDSMADFGAYRPQGNNLRRNESIVTRRGRKLSIVAEDLGPYATVGSHSIPTAIGYQVLKYADGKIGITLSRQNSGEDEEVDIKEMGRLECQEVFRLLSQWYDFFMLKVSQFLS
jgi:hypothetical protein